MHSVTPHGDDARLLTETAAGDAAAFEALVHRYEAPLFHFLRRVTGCAQTAEDVRTWTFLRIHDKAQQFRGGSARAWIFRIAFRGGLNAKRKKKNLAVALDPGAGESLAAAEPGPLGALAAHEDAIRIRRALSAFDPRTQALLWLCAAERMPLEEAARVLRRPSSTLRYQLSKALDRLRRELQESTTAEQEPSYELR
jgi:RNA polymerase sigma-70 factor (ECF subfamily)